MSTDLIIQGEDIASADLRALHELASAHGIERINHVQHQAFRLINAADLPANRAAVNARCAAAQLDFAFVPGGRSPTSACWRWTWIQPSSPSNASTRLPILLARKRKSRP